MPAARTEPDAPPSSPSICVCGYDLAGLPPGAAAKCPECGVVIATIEPRRPHTVVRWTLAAVVCLPIVLILSHAVADRLAPGSLEAWTFHSWVAPALGILTFLISPIAAVVFGYLPRGRATIGERTGVRALPLMLYLAALAVAAMFAAAIAN